MLELIFIIIMLSSSGGVLQIATTVAQTPSVVHKKIKCCTATAIDAHVQHSIPRLHIKNKHTGGGDFHFCKLTQTPNQKWLQG